MRNPWKRRALDANPPKKARDRPRHRRYLYKERLEQIGYDGVEWVVNGCRAVSKCGRFKRIVDRIYINDPDLTEKEALLVDSWQRTSAYPEND